MAKIKRKIVEIGEEKCDDFLLNEFLKSSPLNVEIDITEITPLDVPSIMIEVLCRTTSKTKFEEILRYLNFDLIEKLCENIFYHERIITFQHLIGEKFYRDHLMHMVRVMLLCHKFALTLRVCEEKYVACVLAGLFHDIAYPLERAKDTFQTIFKSLTECFTFFQPVRGAHLDFPDASSNIKLSNLNKIGESVILKILVQQNLTNHGVLSALAFLDLWNLQPLDMTLRKTIYLAAEAIAQHDADVKGHYRYSEQPVTVILILGDELQDWGRPVGAMGWIAVPEIIFQVKNDKIKIEYDYSSTREHFNYAAEVFSPLQQLLGKQKNLSRITLDGGFPELDLTYTIPEYVVWHRSQVTSYLEQISRQVDTLLAWRYDYAEEFGYIKTLFNNLHEEVTYPENFFLAFNRATAEYAIVENDSMFRKVKARADKDSGFSLSWNIKISRVNKPIVATLKEHRFAVKTGLLIKSDKQFRIKPSYKMQKNLEKIATNNWTEKLVAQLKLSVVLFNLCSSDIISELNNDTIEFVNALELLFCQCSKVFHLKSIS